jgi:hypothetical protein
MSSTVYGLSVDAAAADADADADAEKLAHFWAEVLGRDVASGASPEFATLDPDGATPRLSFHQVPEPKSVKNRRARRMSSTVMNRSSTSFFGDLRCVNRRAGSAGAVPPHPARSSPRAPS